MGNCSVLQDQHPWHFVVDDFQNAVEEIAFLCVVEAVLFAGNAKRLARKSSTEDVNIRNVVQHQSVDVAIGHYTVILCIHTTHTIVDITCQHTFVFDGVRLAAVEGRVKSSQTTEEIDVCYAMDGVALVVVVALILGFGCG